MMHNAKARWRLRAAGGVGAWSALLAGAAGPAWAQASNAGGAAQAQSIWELTVRGGFMMIPIALCSLIGLAVVAERLIALRKRSVIPEGFVRGLDKAIAEDASPERALAYCRKRPSPLASVIAAGVRRVGEPIERLERAIEEAGEREALRLRKRLRALAVIASVAPLMGLLGTVFGMISAFQTVAMAPEALGRTEMLAGGIYQALTTTAAGLLVAIPALICHHWISAKIEGLVAEIDRAAAKFVEEHAPALSPALSGFSDSSSTSVDGAATRAAAHVA